jgi:hypothetical protein
MFHVKHCRVSSFLTLFFSRGNYLECIVGVSFTDLSSVQIVGILFIAFFMTDFRLVFGECCCFYNPGSKKFVRTVVQFNPFLFETSEAVFTGTTHLSVRILFVLYSMRICRQVFPVMWTSTPLDILFALWIPMNYFRRGMPFWFYSAALVNNGQ